jgi:hypothetical protein
MKQGNMRFILLIIIIGFIINYQGFSQVIVDSKAQVTDVDFNLVNDQLIITYNIVGSKSSELFNVRVNILTEAGKPVNALSFSGDMGPDISGGSGKQIIWEISKDIAFLDEKIYIEVEAIHQNPKVIKPVSRGKAILLSTIYPGLGSSKITLKGYHLVKGVAGYGALAGSLMSMKKADQSAIDYDNAVTAADRDKYYEAYNDQKLTSRLFLITSGAVWLLDYVTDLAAENRSQKKGFKSNIVYMGPTIISPNYYAGLTMVYNF